MSLMDVFVKIGADTSELESGISKSKSILGSIGKGAKTAMTVAGAAIGTATAAVGAFAASSIEAGKTFDASMSQVAATMGVTTDEIQELRDFAQEMGRTTAFSATQAADALNYMALAGYDAETSMKMLPNVLNLAAAGGMELATASDMVTDAQSALGLSLAETTELVDMMAKTSSKSNTSVAQLGDAILTIGGTAKTLAGGTTELNTALGILADNGIKGAEGGTKLRNVILSLSAPTDKAAEELERLGVETVDKATGNLKSLDEIMGDLSASLEGLGTADKAEIINTIFNKQDIAAVNALLDTSADRWAELTTEIENSTGAADQMAKTQLDNLAGDITLFQSALEGARIAVSDRLTPTLRDFVKFGTEGLSKITDAFEKGGLNKAMDSFGEALSDGIAMIVQKAPQMVAAGVKLLSAFIKGFTKNKKKVFDATREIMKAITDTISQEFPGFKSIMDKIQHAFDAVFGFIERNGALIQASIKGILAGFLAFSAAITVFNALQKGITIVSTAMKILNGELALTAALNPFTAIAAGIGIVTGLMVTLDEKEKAEMQSRHEMATAISEQAREAGEHARDYIQQMNDVYEANMNVKRSVEEQLKPEQDLIEELKGIVDENGKVKEGYEERAQVITEELANAFNIEIGYQDGVIQKYDEVMDKLDELIEKKKGEALLDANKEAYSKALSDQINLFGDLRTVQSEYNETQKDYEEALHNAFVAQDELNKAAERGSPTVGEWGQKLQESYLAMEESKEKLANLKVELDDAGQAYYKNQDFIADYNNLLETTTTGTGDVTKAVEDMTNGIIESAPQDILKKQAEEAINNLQELLDARAEGVAVTEAQIAEATATAQAAVDALTGAGQDGRAGYAEGLSETSDVVEAAQKMVTDGLEAVRKTQDSHSPSVKFRIEGINALNGYIEGIKSKTPELTSRISKIIEDVRKSFTRIVNEALSWGKDLIANFIGGIKEKWNSLKETVGAVAESIKAYLGFSEPTEGPLSNFHTYAPDMMQLFAKGIRDNEDIVKDQLSKSLDFMGSIPAPSIESVSSTSEEVIRLLQEIAANGRVEVVLQEDADRLFRVMQRKSQQNRQVTGQPSFA